MSWYCKKDVLDDLSHFAGSSIQELDEQYIVVGEQPPPACANDIDDNEEFLNRLNGGLGDKLPTEHEHSPDLAGITEMLRMVDKFQSPDCKLNYQRESEDGNDTFISISKLNPNVCNFIPKSIIENECSELDKTGLKDASSSCSKKTCDKLDTSSEKSDRPTIKERSEIIKQQISSPSKEICLKKKIERNLAIASLLKLYSENPGVSETRDNKPKLLTPQDFEKPSSNKKQSNNNTQSLSQTSLKEECEKITQDRNNNDSKSIEDSVLKVHNWLYKDERQTTKEPVLYLGPVTFKKKVIMKPATLSSDISNVSVRKCDSFVPSEYANKLTETYMVRIKTRDERNENIWTKLEKELKNRDEVIKEQKQKTQAENDN